MKKVSIIDSKICNLNSLINALKHLGINYQIINKPNRRLYGDGLIFPGVGSFSNGMKYLKKNNMVTLIKDYAKKKIPILGICLGMQLLTKNSDEFGKFKGIGLVDASVKKLTSRSKLAKVPNIGWRKIFINKDNPLINENDFFYHIHGHYVAGIKKNNILASINFDKKMITVAFQKNNIFGVQFHPEKSNDSGLRILNNFYKYL